MRKQQKLPPFVPLFINTITSPAWLEMSTPARMLYIALKQRYNRKAERAVFLSMRMAAKEVKANKDTVGRLYRELQHFGFIVQVRSATFGPGRGKAAEFRLTDERYKGKPPGREFSYWNGTPFRDFPSETRGRKSGFPSETRGHSRPKRGDGKCKTSIISRPSVSDTSRSSSHLSAAARLRRRAARSPPPHHRNRREPGTHASAQIFYRTNKGEHNGEDD